MTHFRHTIVSYTSLYSTRTVVSYIGCVINCCFSISFISHHLTKGRRQRPALERPLLLHKTFAQDVPVHHPAHMGHLKQRPNKRIGVNPREGGLGGEHIFSLRRRCVHRVEGRILVHNYTLGKTKRTRRRNPARPFLAFRRKQGQRNSLQPPDHVC